MSDFVVMVLKKNITELNRMIQSGFSEIDCDDLVNVDFFLFFFYTYFYVENGTYYDLGYIFYHL